jgi:hypothetical protein
MLPVIYLSITDMLLSSFEEGVIPILNLIMTILKKLDSDVYSDIANVLQGTPEFALSWILTWLAHEIDSVKVIARVFDYFLCSHPLSPVYVAVAVFLLCTFRLYSTKNKHL